MWHSKITQYLHQIGFRMSKSDTSLYIRHESDRPIVIILYVDDLVSEGKDFAEINKVKSTSLWQIRNERLVRAPLLLRHQSEY